MKKTYKIVLTPADQGFMVTVPDFNCNTEGKDMEDALNMARDVIGLMGVTLENMGKELPEPDSVGFNAGAGDIVTSVAVDFEEYRKKEGG